MKWVQPSILKMHYELREEDDVVATLRFRSMWGTLATAENADGCWTFKRVGFLQGRATIRACGSETEIASFKNNTWSGGGTLILADGRSFLLTSNLWQTRLEVQTEAGEELIRLNTKGFLQNRASVEVTPAGLQLRETAWLTLFAWYVVVMMQMDAGSVAAIGGA